MIRRQWLRLAVIGPSLLFAATTLVGATEPHDLHQHEECAAMEPAHPLCTPPDGVMDVIRIPPIVIMGNRFRLPSENKHDPEFRKYLKQVRKRIDQEKDYPFTAQQMRWEGSALIKFTISPQGELLQTRVDRTSGFQILDEAAEMAVKKAFPVVPIQNLFAQPIEVKIPVMFELH